MLLSVRSCSCRCLALLVLCLVSPPVAGEPKPAAKGKVDVEVAAIRQRWLEAEKSDSSVLTVEFDGGDSFPGVGRRKSTVTLEWTFPGEDAPEDPHTMLLLRATHELKVAAYSFKRTYLFSPEGRLLFYYVMPAVPQEDVALAPDYGQPAIEWRLYFSGDRVLRRIRGAKVLDTPLPEEEREVRQVLKEADNLKRLFIRSAFLATGRTLLEDK